MRMDAPEAVWFSTYRLPQHGRMRVFAFPYSGAGALVYSPWARALQDSPVDFLGVQLPGRESRLREGCITDLTQLVRVLLPAIKPLLDKPFVFFGHSLGALLAFELCHALHQQGLALPKHLFVSAFRAPDSPNPNPPIRHRSDAELIARLRAYGGTPEAVLAEPELLALLLPIVRADSSLHETYQYQWDKPLPCPITAFTGAADSFVAPQQMEGWSKHTDAAFEQVVYPGGHFFLHDAMPDMRQRLLAALVAG